MRMSQAGMRKSWVVRKKAQALMRLLSVKGASGAHSAYVRLVPACRACLYLQVSIKPNAASGSKLCQVCNKDLPPWVLTDSFLPVLAVHTGLELTSHKAACPNWAAVGFAAQLQWAVVHEEELSHKA